MSDTEQKRRNMIRMGRVTRVSADDGPDTISQVESMGRPINATIVYPYGISANAPENATVLLFSVGGSAQDMAGVPFMPENRVSGLKGDDFAVGNPMTKSHIFFSENGDVEMIVGTSTFKIEKDGAITGTTAGGFFEMKANGQMNINGNLTVDP